MVYFACNCAAVLFLLLTQDEVDLSHFLFYTLVYIV